MSYQEKRTIVSIVTGVLLIAAYCIYAFGRVAAGLADADDLKFWGGTMLVFVGIGVAVTIVIQILFHIAMSVGIAVKERGCGEEKIEKTIKTTMTEDEMDKLIELKASKTGYYIGGMGLIAALISLVFNGSAVIMLNIIFLSFFAGAMTEGFVSLHYYRKGIKNG